MPDNMRSSRSEPGSVGFERLRAALDRLVAAGTITPAQAAAVRQEVASDGTAPGTRLARPTWTTVLAEIGGYVGGAFVFGAAAVLVSDNWKDLSTAARLAVLDV